MRQWVLDYSVCVDPKRVCVVQYDREVDVEEPRRRLLPGAALFV